MCTSLPELAGVLKEKENVYKLFLQLVFFLLSFHIKIETALQALGWW